MSSLKEYLKVKYYQYELLTGLYMLESWEKLIFNTFVLAAFVLSIYTTINYLPENVNYFFSELFEYFPDMKAYMPSRLIQTVRDLYSRQEL